MVDQQLYSIREAASRFGVDYQVLRAAALTGDIDSVRPAGGTRSPRYVTEESVMSWIQRIKERGGDITSGEHS